LPTIQTTLPTLQKLKHSSSQAWLLASSHSARTVERPQLNKLRRRKKPSLEVTPKMVQNVLQKYFIPVFEAQRHRQRNLKTSRTAEFGKSLSETLVDELLRYQSTLKDLNLKLKLIQEDKERKKLEISSLKEKMLNLQGLMNAEKAELPYFLSSYLSFRTGSVCQENEYSDINLKNRELKNLLANESTRNVLLQDKAMVLEHWNSLFKMQSDIMGEQLKGVYFASDSLSRELLLNFYIDQRKICKDACESIIQLEFSHEFTTQINILVINETTDQAFFKLDERKSLLKELKDRSSAYKYDQEWLFNEIKKKIEERDLFLEKFIDVDKKNSTLEEEYEKMRNIVKEIKAKNKMNDLEEKVCKFCKKVFIERDNFHWSCRNHLSEWGESQYFWCCGATDKESPGCQLSKHISDEVEDGKVTENPKSQVKLKCINCQEYGHEFKDCIKDPNPKTEAGFKSKPIRKNKRKLTSSRWNKLKNEDLDFFEYFDDIDLARREAVLEEFELPFIKS
jgi:hypothetical protein